MDHSPFDFILVENSSRQSLACLELESIGSLECKLIATTTLLDLSNHQHLHTSKEWNLRQKPGERQDNSTSGRLQVLPLRKSQGQPSMSNSWTNCRKEPDMGRGPLQEAAWQYLSTLSVNTLLCRVPCWVQASNELMSSTFRIFNLWVQFFQTSLRESTYDIQHQQPPFLSATSHLDPFHTEQNSNYYSTSEQQKLVHETISSLISFCPSNDVVSSRWWELKTKTATKTATWVWPPPPIAPHIASR